MQSISKIILIIWIAVFLISPTPWAKEEDAFGKGMQLVGEQRYDEAIEAFSTAIAMIPRDYQAYNFRGVAWALKGDYDKAIADYNKAIEIRPHYAEAYNNRGFARTRHGDLDNALDDYARAIEINPFFIDAYNNKAWVLATCANPRFRNGDQAVRLAQKAVELKPDVTSLDTLAAAYAAAGNFDAAVDTQQNAIQKLLLADRGPEVPKYLAHLNSYKSKQALMFQYGSGIKKTDSPVVSVAAEKPAKEYKAMTASSGSETRVPAAATKTESKPAPGASQKVAAAPAPETRLPVAATKTESKPAPGASQKAAAAPAPANRLPAAATKTGQTSTPVIKPSPYTIQVSAYRNPQTSNQVAKKLINNGDPAFTCPVDISGKGKWYRVFIGNYTNLAEAKVAASNLKKRRFNYVHIARKPYTVQVGLPVTDSEARKLKSRLESRGYLAYSLPVVSGNNQTRILIGAYETREAAENLAAQLKKDGFDPQISLR